MNKLIGKISGNDWSVAPEGAEYVDMNCRYESDIDQHGQWEGMFVWVKNEYSYWGSGGEEIYYVNVQIGLSSNKNRYISRERDLEGVKEVVKYSSLQDLPIGWFVKHYSGSVSMWNGFTLCTVNPKHDEVDSWSRYHVSNFEGWEYFSSYLVKIVAYADRYNGEWIPVDDTRELRKKELQEQIAKLTKELADL